MSVGEKQAAIGSVPTVVIDESVMEDYDIALTEGVDDEAVKDENATVSFTTTSYGADYTVDGLVKRVKNNSFFIPPFQRSFIWNQKHASRFVESLLLGLPVPGIFLYKEQSTNRHLVVDGQQRLRTLQYFLDGVFGEKKFRLIGVKEPWSGRTFQELDPADRLKIEDSIIHATIFQQEYPLSGAGKDQSIYYVFERINSGGIRLSPHEIRTAINYGDFIDLLKSLNENRDWRYIFGQPNKRLKDQELILRFFALFFNAEKYSRPMGEFLNRFVESHPKLDNQQVNHFSSIFQNTVSTCRNSIVGRPFRVSAALNAAIYDSAMFGVAKRLEKGQIRDSSSLNTAYKRLFSDPEYVKAYVRATADEESVKKRLQLATSAFENIP